MASPTDPTARIVEHPVEHLVPGMELARDALSQDGKILVNQGTIINQQAIAKLRKWEVATVFITSEAEVSTISDPRIREFMASYNQSVAVVENAFENMRSSQEVPMDTFSATAESITEKVSSSGNLIDLLYDLPKCDDYTHIHSVNVSVICSLIALWLKMPPEMINAVSLAGLLHDVGKSQLPKNILHRPDKLPPGDYDLYKQHVRYGYDMVAKIDGFSRSILSGILEHHEREDGSGYLQSSTSADIHPYAKIVAVADVYDEAMTINRNPDVKQSPYVSLEYLRSNIFRFDAKIALTFINNMTNFLSCNTVVLTDNRQGMVVFVNKDRPSRSIVQLTDGSILDLQEHPDLSIHYVVR